MRFWADLRVKTKLMALVAGGCRVLGIVGGVGLINMKGIGDGIGETESRMETVAALQEMKNDFLGMRLSLVYMLVLTDAGKIEKKNGEFLRNADRIKEILAGVEKKELDGKERELLRTFREGFDAYMVQGVKLAEMAKAAAGSGNPQDRLEAGRFATESVAPLYAKSGDAISGLVDYSLKSGQQMYGKDIAAYHSSIMVMAGLMLTTLIVALWAGRIIANSISRPLNRIFETLAKVAAGDLTARSDIDTRDEMGMLAREVNETGDKLRSIISRLAQTSQHVATSANQLHSPSEQTATGAEQVASQAGSVATAGEEMAATSNEIAQNCHLAAGGARQANEAALAGAAVVEETVAVMNRIAAQVRESARTVESLGSRSDQIGAIIGTIEDIADQTNLLALNAAIEAARAGEQGRGFAVVADEVRALAERTTKATREIGTMIKAIQEETRGAVTAMDEGVREVEKGTAEAAKSGDALREILEQINSVTMQVNQIATAAEEQTATTGEISNNMHQITDVVQQTARGAEESASSASQLAGLAEDLQRLVGQFRLAA